MHAVMCEPELQEEDRIAVGAAWHRAAQKMTLSDRSPALCQSPGGQRHGVFWETSAVT